MLAGKITLDTKHGLLVSFLAVDYVGSQDPL